MKPKIILDPAFRRMQDILATKDLDRLHAAADVIWGKDEPMPDAQIEDVREEIVAIAGFRLGLGGAQAHFGVTPDMATYAKAISNGYAMGAVVGRGEVMSVVGQMFVSSTYWSDAVGLAAALATIRELRARDAFQHITQIGARFQHSFNELAEEHELPLRAAGLPQQIAIAASAGDAQQKRGLKDLYVQEMTKRGFFTSFGVAPCYAHSDADLEQVAGAWRDVFPLLRAAWHAGDWEARIAAPSVDAFRRQVG